jgi:hypothetical protein
LAGLIFLKARSRRVTSWSCSWGGGVRRGAAGDPIEDVGVGAVEQRLVKPGEVSVGEAAEDQVALARAAMPGTKQHSLAANLG